MDGGKEWKRIVVEPVPASEPVREPSPQPAPQPVPAGR